MDFSQTITIIHPDGSETTFSNAYIHDNNSAATYWGDFLPNRRHVAIIPCKTCNITVGSCARYNDTSRTITGVYDNTRRSRLMPHIRLTLE